MEHKDEYWKVEVSPEDARDIDPELFEEMNEIQEIEQTTNSKQQSISKKIIAVVTISVFCLLLMANWLKVFNMPSISFLNISSQLSADPEIKQLKEAVVKITTAQGAGTGFNIDPKGVIITNYHVIEGAKNIIIEFSSSQVYSGKVIEARPELDLAVLQIDGKGLPVLELSPNYMLTMGEEVLIIGNPLGFSKVVKQGQFLGEVLVQGIEEQVLMIKGPIHKGSSGSPVFNDNGKVIAVIFATLAMEENQQLDMGLAISIDHLYYGK